MERNPLTSRTCAIEVEGEAARRSPAPDDLPCVGTKARIGDQITLDEALLVARRSASSPHSNRALRSDLQAFDLWCRERHRVAFPAVPETVADYLDHRGGQGSKSASLARYKASIARMHQLLDLEDPTQAKLVKLRFAALRRKLGTATRQARPLRFMNTVPGNTGDPTRALNVRTLLESCPNDLPGLRDYALLSTAYDTGLRAFELVAIRVEHIIEALDPDARLLLIPRRKNAGRGEGATAFLSPRSVRAILAWQDGAGIATGALFRRVNVRQIKARPAVSVCAPDDGSASDGAHAHKVTATSAPSACKDYDVGKGALHAGSIGPIYRAIARRAFRSGFLEDFKADELARLLQGVSAQSTRVGLRQDLLTIGEDLAEIMASLRSNSPRMQLAYEHNPAAQAGALNRLTDRSE